MALVKYLNYYIDDDGYYRRIPWDTWMLDGSFVGISPVSFAPFNTIEYDSNGKVTLNMDFLDISEEGDLGKKDSEILLMQVQTNERSFVATYDNVAAFYESEFSQTYELDYDKPPYNGQDD